MTRRRRCRWRIRSRYCATGSSSSREPQQSSTARRSTRPWRAFSARRISRSEQEEALSLADSVAVLRDGVIVQQGTPAELYSTPVDAPLASFLGAANLIEARFDGGWAHTVLGQLQLNPDSTRAPGLTHGVVIVRPEQLEVRPREDSVANGLADRKSTR